MKYEIQKIGDQLRANTIIEISIKNHYSNYLLNQLEKFRIRTLQLRYELLKDEKYCIAIAYLNIK